jgi:hypothetical protein
MKLSDVSPLAAMVTGEGTMGKIMSQGFGGMIPAAIAGGARKDREQEERLARAKALEEEAKTAKPMKKGGRVSSASSRADGCCVKGKTKGRMV